MGVRLRPFAPAAFRRHGRRRQPDLSPWVEAASRLGREASQMARAYNGSLLVSPARTSPAAVDALESAITAPHYFHRWREGEADNPYMGMLAWADRLIVTGDGIAMLSEACATGKPVKMFDLGGMRDLNDESTRDFRLGGTLYAVLLRWFWRRLSRDITLVHRQLREAGYAAWIEEILVTARVPAETDLQRAVAAVRKLLGDA
ncbi:MAG: ELM1/GtrOC1 family putative glycosyltransferase [Halioglobus sp.]